MGSPLLSCYSLRFTGLWSWLNQLYQYGVAFIEKAPARKNVVARLAGVHLVIWGKAV